MSTEKIALNQLQDLSLEEDFAGGKNHFQQFGEHSLTKDGVIPFDTQLAIISHYLNNAGTEYGSVFEKEAKGLVYDMLAYKYPQEELKGKWEQVAEDPLEYNLFPQFFHVPFPAPEHPKFSFIDLFAGIGGFRIAMQNLGGKCVFSSEWNKYSQRTYLANFGDVPFGDITKESTKEFIPKGFDVLCAGFPCQPFSIAGVVKKNSLGRPTGFRDKTQGTLFFDVAEILSRYRPKAFYLENVKNLLSHDHGKTFKVIEETLNELRYSIHCKVMDGKAFVPQHRERIMIVGFDRDVYNGKENFEFPELGEPMRCVRDILDKKVEEKYTLSNKLWLYLQNYAVKQKAKGNGFGFGMVDLNGITRTLSARYYKDGSEILIPQTKGKNPRRLTPHECARLMGYPDKYIINAVSDVQAYRQCGNSVVVPLINAVSEQLVKTMEGETK